MSLCSLCLVTAAVPCPVPAWQEASISFQFSVAENGYNAYFTAQDIGGSAEPFGVPYHDTLDALKESAETCPLCGLILERIEVFIAGFKESAREESWEVVRDSSFRLVARHDGMDGFAVVAKQRPASGQREFSFRVVALIGFCRGPDSSNSNLLRGVMVRSDAGLDEPLDMAAAWIRDCVDTHQDHCHPPKGRLPTRVLDVDELWHQEKVRLLENLGSNVREGEYVALSHCWGGDGSAPGHTMTDTETLQKHMAGIDVTELPQNFQDAVKVTRHLGIRYLWIDSLCICQDSVDDWVRESASMTDVYSRAHVVIAADSASNTAVGFLKRPERRHIPITLSTADGGALTAMAYGVRPQLTNEPETWVLLPWEPLSTRGWTLQERLLPHRVLHYGTSQMMFECNCHFISEDGYSAPGRWSSLYPGPAADRELFRIRGTDGYEQAWRRIVGEYSSRNLTVRSDKLPAIAGLAQSFLTNLVKQHGQVEYLAGLWSHSIAVSLVWQSLCQRDDEDWVPPETPLPGDEEYVAPSWSWAALPGKMWYGHGANELESIVTVTGWRMTPRSKHAPLAELIDGWIRLRAPLFPVTTVEKVVEEKVHLGAAPSQGLYVVPDRYGARSPAIRDWLQGKELFGIAIARKPMSEEGGTAFYHVLLVEPRGTGEGGLTRYTRLGLMLFWHSVGGKYLKLIEDPGSVAEVLLV